MMNICGMKLLILVGVFVGHGVVELEASHHVYAQFQSVETQNVSEDQPYRTGYHFQPHKNWMNDPNGPMIYKGIYHFFYQYNPKGAMWGNIVWAHSTSEDLVNWKSHKIAIYPTQHSDVKGTWSGSATILPGGKPAILFTGINKSDQQLQNLALPKNLSDPFLLEWVKSDRNPLMVSDKQNRINGSAFRDPTTAWLGPDRRWRVVIGSKNHDTGLAILYRSRDFIRWTKAKNPLHSSRFTGMWECPDFFPVSVEQPIGVDLVMRTDLKVKYVLKLSLDDTKHDYYTIGDFDPVKDIYTPDEGSIEGDSGLRYDYGKFYASKSFFDSSTNRRILWGWINESLINESDAMLMGWAGLQAVPRVILLDKSKKQLVQWPIREIEKLRTNPIHLSTKFLKQKSLLEVSGITAAQADVEISFKITDFSNVEEYDPRWTDPKLICRKKGASVKGSLGPFGLLVLASEDMQEYTAVFFRIFKAQQDYVVLMCSDQSRSSLNPKYDKANFGAFLDVNPVHEQLSLRSLIDHSIVESFGGKGKSCITARVYPELAIYEDARLFIFNYGSVGVTMSNSTAWSMKKADINKHGN